MRGLQGLVNDDQEVGAGGLRVDGVLQLGSGNKANVGSHAWYSNSATGPNGRPCPSR